MTKKNITTIGDFTFIKIGKLVQCVLPNAQRTWSKGYVVQGAPKPILDIIVNLYSDIDVPIIISTLGNIHTDGIDNKWVAGTFTYLTDD